MLLRLAHQNGQDVGLLSELLLSPRLMLLSPLLHLRHSRLVLLSLAHQDGQDVALLSEMLLSPRLMLLSPLLHLRWRPNPRLRLSPLLL